MRYRIGLFILATLCIARLGAFPVHAQQPAATLVSTVDEPQATANPTQPVPTPTPVEYLLPYPGILPDHPMYGIKILRDRIMEFLINDPVRKSEFYLLQADKRLAMSIALADQSKCPLAESTASKGSKYMDQSVSMLKSYASPTKPAPGYVTSKLETSLKKHDEVLTNMKKRCPAQAAQLDGIMAFLVPVGKTLHALPR